MAFDGGHTCAPSGAIVAAALLIVVVGSKRSRLMSELLHYVTVKIPCSFWMCCCCSLKLYIVYGQYGTDPQPSKRDKRNGSSGYNRMGPDNCKSTDATRREVARVNKEPYPGPTYTARVVRQCIRQIGWEHTFGMSWCSLNSSRCELNSLTRSL